MCVSCPRRSAPRVRARGGTWAAKNRAAAVLPERRPPDPAPDAVPDRRRQRVAAARRAADARRRRPADGRDRGAARGRGSPRSASRVEDLELIVLTHQHDDHVGLAGELRRRSGAEVAGTAALAAFLADAEREHGRRRRLRGRADAPPRRDREDRRDARTASAARSAASSRDVARRADRRRRRRAASPAAGRWRVRERPGHSPTDTVLAGDGLLLAGDHLLREDLLQPDRARPDRRRRSRRRWRRRRSGRARCSPTSTSLRATAADDRGELILPGHGDPFTRRRRRSSRSGSTCTSGARRRSSTRSTHPRTAADVGRDLWRHVPVTQAYLVLSEVLGHLDLLEARGAVRDRGARRRRASTRGPP